MLARTEPTERPEPTPAPEPKRRTITLTNARPVSIIEEHWPVIAEGSYKDEHPSGLEFLKIDFRVREALRVSTFFNDVPLSRYIVHGKFEYSREDAGPYDGAYEVIRVGRLLNDPHHTVDETLLGVGAEMKERVNGERHKYVTLALDACFSKLAARVL